MVTRMVKARDVTWCQVGDDTVIIKEDGQATHVLNATAAYVWDRCDGEHDTDSIAGEICQCFDVVPEDVSDDVQSIIDQLANFGLLRELDISGYQN